MFSIHDGDGLNVQNSFGHKIGRHCKEKYLLHLLAYFNKKRDLMDLMNLN